MSRHSPSRRSSFSYTDTPPRRSSASSNPNIFSDDYALEPIDSRLDLTLQDSFQTEHTLTDDDRLHESSNITPYPAIPPRLSAFTRPNSIWKRAGSENNDATASLHDGATERTLSISSRFSFVRSQSPYSGPTQPSHPYAMYPQITRASSVASGSTMRPPENPFVPIGGPEHPYSLYPQNTVPVDDDDEDIGTQPIPLGFPRLGLGPQRPSGTTGSDVGDIVGTDGHIEQLPPYTRYADNIIAKGDMANINGTSTAAASRRPSQRSTLVAIETPSERMEVRESSEREILLNDEETKKETMRERLQKKVCGGLALWLLLLIVISVVFAGVVGGIIGGVVGRRQGTDLGYHAGAAAAATTTTGLIDADPASTDSNTPACPTGRYTIPFNQTQEISNCVMNGHYYRSWGCLDIAFLGITISDSVIDGKKKLQVRFDDYSVDTRAFRYGPQPPDFNGTAFDLEPYNDKDNTELGVAMFFWKQFDKLSILPSMAIKPDQRRGIDERYVRGRGYGYNWGDGAPLEIGDEPWYCFWNGTINEFWIFLEEPIEPTTTWSLASTATLPPGSMTNSAGQQTDGSSVQGSGTSSGKWAEVTNFPTPTIQGRGVYTTPYYPQYPQLVKMIEKRKPYGNIEPYCQKMQVLADWRIVPNEDNTMVPILESEYAEDPGTGSFSNRDSVMHELESNCVCEWISR